MSELPGMTVADLVRSLKARGVRLPSEIGAFVALEACEALVGHAAAPSGDEVRIADDGRVGVFVGEKTSSSEEAAAAVVRLLGALLVAAGTSVPRALVEVLEEDTEGRDLTSLRDQLEASLVPLNRSAARRILARLLREAARAPIPAAAPTPAPTPGDASLDAQLDELLGGSAGSTPKAEEVTATAGTDSTLSETSGGGVPDDATVADESPRLLAEAQALAAQMAERASGDDGSHAMQDGGAEMADPGASVDDAFEREFLESQERGKVLPWLLAIAAVIAVTIAVLTWMRPDLVDAALGRSPAVPEAPDTSAADEEEALRRHRGQWGTLTVRTSRERAQTLLLVGRGPAVASDLPRGVAHEFVAVAEGRRPTRAVLEADAEWTEASEDGQAATGELAMQVGDAVEEGDTFQLGPSRLPTEPGRPTGERGNVRVITNPRGAEVFLLVGIGERVVIENLRADAPAELLVFDEGYETVRRSVSPEEWVVGEDGARSLELELELTARETDG